MSKTVLVELSDALADAAESAGKATVLVNARRRMPASGVAYAADLILTADHVIEREEDITVHLEHGTQVSAKVAGRDAGSDLALLKLESAAAHVLSRVTRGDRVLVKGSRGMRMERAVDALLAGLGPSGEAPRC